MTPPITALLLALGATAWVYSKISRKTGGNGRDSAIVAAVAGVISFGIMLTVMNAIS